MKDFDSIRVERADGVDRTFRLGGEDFSYRRFFHPDALIQAQGAADDATLLGLLDDAMVHDLLEPGQEKKWAKVRARENPLAPSLKDIIDVCNYVTEEVADRPTVPSPDSSEPSGNGGTNSTARSRSKASTSAS